MRGTRAPYLREFRWQMVNLVRAGRSAAELGRKFEPSAESVSERREVDPIVWTVFSPS